ncbi:MAG: DUF4147 domain-containing protein, partial [Thermoplasmata archaeon]|nr:DUF4147 domain-containing protein [Thermoplasmata archaeon]
KADRFREVAFVALGNAAVSQALGVVDALKDRVTQGLIIGPTPAPAELPFQHREIPSGWPGAAATNAVVADVTELLSGLQDRDLLILLLSPGALSSLSLAPTGSSGAEWSGWLKELYQAGATGAEVGKVARILGDGLVGGRLGSATAAEVETIVVERGDGGVLVGGGPTIPVTAAEIEELRVSLARLRVLDGLPAEMRQRLSAPTGPPLPRSGVSRPVVVAGPADALRGAADAVGERRWMPRLAALTLHGRPEVVADDFLALTDRLLIDNADGIQGSDRRGLVAFATTTFDLPEGVDERPAIAAFLRRAGSEMRRRDGTIGAMRTAGAVEGDPPGAVTGALSATSSPVRLRAIRMRFGITDVGCLLVAQFPVGKSDG